MSDSLSRRQWLGSAALAGAGCGLALQTNANLSAQDPKAAATKASSKGNIKQSIVFWCFNVAGEKWDIETTCKHAKALGCGSVELGDPADWPTLKKHGLVCAIAPNGMPGAPFMKGFNNPKYHDEVIARTTEVIDKCAEFGFPSVIAFTGFKFRTAEDPNSGEISLDEGFDNCVKGLKKIIGHAEKKKVTICLEHLNSRDGSHPMKGHPGYQGDDVDYCAKIIRAVGSERMKLLFDIYHVQIMNGDVIRRIEQLKDVIGHVHTAGNPGRGELDENQEINYPPIMRKLVEVGYQGYVGQEFIPTRDPLAGLTQAVKWCDV
jgi:sugar phosphate isomerase/epimerase